MTVADFITLSIILIAALATTVLFFYGLWHVVRQMRTVRDFVTNAKDLVRSKYFPRSLARARNNPLLPPGNHAWEAAAVMNPAAVEFDGRVHLFYRAIGIDGGSRIGYASSDDGVNFTDRLPYPVFMVSSNDDHLNAAKRKAFDPHLYAALVASGGSWSGAEDPRAVKIGDRVYLSFSAFQGWDSLRIGVTSINADDLKNKQWKWSPVVYLSAPKEVHKNWVIFPRKINGKFAVLHAFTADRSRAMVEYVDSLDEDPPVYIKSEAPHRQNFDDQFKEEYWDSRIRGAGPPPIETPQGWLVLYHANDVREQGKYKLGALLLDLNDPSKIIARSTKPVLEPDGPYENGGIKPGIVYACGAIVRDGMLQVYYGGADNFVCMAAVPLNQFIEHLIKGDDIPELMPILRQQFFVRSTAA